MIAASIGNEAVVVQNACLPNTSGPLLSNMVYMGVPPTAKRWTVPSSLTDHATLRLGRGMVLCYNVVFLLMAFVLSLLPVAAIVAAIHTLPVPTTQKLFALAGSCNTPASMAMAASDWVPTSNLVPPLTCARLATGVVSTIYSWRAPLETLQQCARLMMAQLAFYAGLILTAILWKRMLVGRFQSGVWDFWDVRSKEWIRQFGGSMLKQINLYELTLSKALAGSQWRMVIYRLSGMRVGKRVFVDRDVMLMGARKHIMPRYPHAPI